MVYEGCMEGCVEGCVGMARMPYPPMDSKNGLPKKIRCSPFSHYNIIKIIFLFKKRHYFSSARRFWIASLSAS